MLPARRSSRGREGRYAERSDARQGARPHEGRPHRARRDARHRRAPTAQGIGQQAALKACDAAGYKTVKFTGYIMAGGFARNLKPDDRGEVPGYRYYDNAETTAERLDKEIELGRRTW